MKKIAVLFLGLAISIVSIGPSAAFAAGSASLTLSPTNTSVDTGDTFSLSVLVDPNGESLDTARVELDWDADYLEVLSFDLGSLFPNLSPSSDIDNTNGNLSYGAFKFGTPVTSSGTLATVTFHALSAGTATISVSDTSKLIEDGDEMIDNDTLGTASITISGEDVASEAPEETIVEEETPSSSASGGTSEGTEADALEYFGALAGYLPSDDADWDMVHCIAYNDCYDENNRNLDYEVAALARFNSKYAADPTSGMDWNAIHALAYTEVGAEVLGLDSIVSSQEDTVADQTATDQTATDETATDQTATTDETATGTEESFVDTELSLEEQALVYFGAFYGRMPSSSDDWDALHCIAYGGCAQEPQDVDAEGSALVIFGAKYGFLPSTDMEWNVIHTLAYTDFLNSGEAATTDETASEAATTEETTAEELSLEEQAIGWFGAITGEMPSSDADWLAIDYMVNGYTPEEQDLEAESAAIATFVDVWGALPSSDQDWNIVAAIAYSGAF